MRKGASSSPESRKSRSTSVLPFMSGNSFARNSIPYKYIASIFAIVLQIQKTYSYSIKCINIKIFSAKNKTYKMRGPKIKHGKIDLSDIKLVHRSKLYINVSPNISTSIFPSLTFTESSNDTSTVCIFLYSTYVHCRVIRRWESQISRLSLRNQ